MGTTTSPRPLEFAYIKNVYNGEYLCSSASKMTSSYSTPTNLFRIMLVNAATSDQNGPYYIQNQQNAEFLTSSASKMSSSAGYDQQFRIIPAGVSGHTYWYIQNVSNGEYLCNQASKMSTTAGTQEQFLISEPPLPFTQG
jgi:hypothetical protein